MSPASSSCPFPASFPPGFPSSTFPSLLPLGVLYCQSLASNKTPQYPCIKRTPSQTLLDSYSFFSFFSCSLYFSLLSALPPFLPCHISLLLSLQFLCFFFYISCFPLFRSFFSSYLFFVLRPVCFDAASPFAAILKSPTFVLCPYHFIFSPNVSFLNDSVLFLFPFTICTYFFLLFFCLFYSCHRPSSPSPLHSNPLRF